jgi:hypothetical protein
LRSRSTAGAKHRQAALRGFLDSSPDQQRRQIVEELRSKPQSQQFIPLYAAFDVQVPNTCTNY